LPLDRRIASTSAVGELQINGKRGMRGEFIASDRLGAVMDFELDHLFVCVSEGGGPESDRRRGWPLWRRGTR